VAARADPVRLEAGRRAPLVRRPPRDDGHRRRRRPARAEQAGADPDSSTATARRRTRPSCATDKPTTADLHPTMKPVLAAAPPDPQQQRPRRHRARPVRRSGSTLIAAEQADRRAFLMELDPGYCDVIRRRYETFVGGPGQVKPSARTSGRHLRAKRAAHRALLEATTFPGRRSRLFNSATATRTQTSSGERSRRSSSAPSRTRTPKQPTAPARTHPSSRPSSRSSDPGTARSG
jgi:hypothetical protein